LSPWLFSEACWILFHVIDGNTDIGFLFVGYTGVTSVPAVIKKYSFFLFIYLLLFWYVHVTCGNHIP
jgi:hypothetical protein